MTDKRQFVAVDMGAESGRLMMGTLCEGRLELTEIHRFENGPMERDGTLRWDFANRLLPEVKRGIGMCARAADGPIAGIGVDSWGVDFGLLDAEGDLIDAPYHYRDSRTDGMLDEAFRLMPRREIYENTGIQFMSINSLYQLLAMRLQSDPALSRATKLMFMADLIAYHLCGKVFAEYSLASTSQILDMKTGRWSEKVLNELQLPIDIMPEVIRAGTEVGRLLPEIAAQAGCGAIPILAVGSHDTASAVAAVPAQEGSNWAYLSSGTWSLMGVEIPSALISDDTYDCDFTNEGGVENTIRLLKNMSGLWLVQECRRQWQREGEDLSYAELTGMAQEAKPFAARIMPDHGEFASPGDMPKKINRYLSRSAQSPLTDRGEMIRSILEALAFSYRKTLDEIERITGKRVDVVHIVGGGTQNELLNQFAANAMNRDVITGPIEATSIGNILMQARATGVLDSMDAIRHVVRNSFPTKRYTPEDREVWEGEYAKWLHFGT